MLYRIRNIGKGAKGIEKAGGGFAWIEPGEEKVVKPANMRLVDRDPNLEAEPVNPVPPPPASLVKQVAAAKSGPRKRRARKAAKRK